LAGRKKGQINKKTLRFKSAMNNLLEMNAENMNKWLEQVARDDPKGALDCIFKMAEYIYPKISRIEHTGEDGGALTIEHMIQSLQSNPVEIRGNADIVPNKTVRESAQPILIDDQPSSGAREKPLKLAMSADQSGISTNHNENTIDYDAIIDHDTID